MGLGDPRPSDEEDREIAPQIRTDSISRLVSAASRLILAVVSSIVTARWLGPAGKGAFTTIHYLATLLTYACTLGFGEATIVLVNRGVFSLQTALSSSLIPVGAASLMGVVVLMVVGGVAGWSGITASLGLAGGFVIVGSFSYLLMGVENARLGIRFTSLLSIVSGVTGIVLMVGLVAVLDLGLPGAMAATLLSTAVVVIALFSAFRKEGLSLRPTFDRGFLRAALRLGAVLEGAHLLMALAQRVDLLIVYWLVGEAQAGYYSIALTVGQVASYAASSLAYAAFPRVAAAGDQWVTLARRVVRMAALVGLITGALLWLIVPFAVPAFLGSEFQQAVGVSMALVVVGVVTGMATALARSAAGAGYSSIYIAVFAAELAVMLSLDLILIPSYGIGGAAIAATCSAVIGLAVALLGYRKVGNQIAIRDLVPTSNDLLQLRSLVRGLSRAARQEVSGS